MNNGKPVTRATGLKGAATPPGTASIGVSIRGTPLTVLVQTPDGGKIYGAEVEVWNLRQQTTGATTNTITFNILDSEYDAKVATNNNQVTVKVRSPHYGPAPASPSTPVTPGEVSQNFDFTKGTPSTVTMILQDAGLARYTDTYDSIPARSLTRRQARDALLCLHRQGSIRLIPEPTFNHTGTVCNAANCKVASPLVGQLVGMSSKVGDVTLFMINGVGPNGLMPETNDQVAGVSSALDLTLLDVRNAVGLWRLAQILQNNYFASSLYHIGISGGGGRTDCHGQGRAIDFGGAAGNSGTVTVYNDWGKMQVWDLNDPDTDLATKRRLPAGQNWPPVDGTLMYRLDPLPPAGRDLARRVFQDVYNFALQQYADKTETGPQSAPPSTIGGGGYIMNPDYYHSDPLPSPHGREAHIGHIHMQIGGTGTDATPPVEPEP
jgi:hypothetical protein